MTARFFAFAAVLLALGAATAAPPAPSAPADINLTAFANGALVESSSSDYGGGWTANRVTDENSATGWAPVKDAKGPFVIVISLPERSEIHALEFDNASVDGDDGKRGAKEIAVDISDTATGFAPLTTVTLKVKADRQRFALAKPGTGRYIRLTLKSNQGDPDYTELMEFRAFGKQLTHTPMPANLSGTYNGGAYGLFHLQQTGASLTGCYEHDGGLVQGGAEGMLMRLTWHQTNSSGPAVMVLRRDGKGFEGWWQNAGETEWHADWSLKKVSDKIGSCPNWNPAGASANQVATALAAEGRVRLYGINFDTDSDHLRGDAKPAVDQLLAALKANAAWKVSIEGHTDSTGNAPHNLDLSQRRAASVKTALVAGGIDAGRLSTQGFGQTKPVAANDTEIGRAQNRRVEVARQ
ncbi:MAG TPA: OmpA family protein [Rhizomicrobium sp.]|jgi:outer membrane protein OmpA-like peptidoglycan-associated protein|nr:OmpA family protein [Rhizomicrobium sp.]